MFDTMGSVLIFTMILEHDICLLTVIVVFTSRPVPPIMKKSQIVIAGRFNFPMVSGLKDDTWKPKVKTKVKLIFY